MTTLTFNAYYTLIAAVLVLLLGSWLVRKIKFLQDFNIPEPMGHGHGFSGAHQRNRQRSALAIAR